MVAGVGFMLVAGGGLVFIDLDHCRDPETGVLSDFAKAVIALAP